MLPSGNTRHQSVKVGGDRLKHLQYLQAAPAHEGSLAAAQTLPSLRCPLSLNSSFPTIHNCSLQPELVLYRPGMATGQAPSPLRADRHPGQWLLFCRNRLRSSPYGTVSSNPDVLCCSTQRGLMPPRHGASAPFRLGAAALSARAAFLW